jgi:hypothetical protein
MVLRVADDALVDCRLAALHDPRSAMCSAHLEYDEQQAYLYERLRWSGS